MIVSLLQRIKELLTKLKDKIVSSDIIAPTYALDNNYYVGDNVYYNGKLYKAIDNSVGILPTDESVWEEIRISDEISDLFNSMITVETRVVTSLPYTAERDGLVSIGGYCVNAGAYYLYVNIDGNRAGTSYSGYSAKDWLISHTFPVKKGQRLEVYGSSNVGNITLTVF